MQPLKHLSRHDVCPADWNYVLKARSLITTLQDLARQEGHIEPQQSFCSLSLADLGSAFDRAYTKLLAQVYSSEVERQGDKTIGTLYNKLHPTTKKRQHSDIESEV